MATLISKATGNFTTNTTWGLANANSFLDAYGASSTALTTSYTYSNTFVPGAVTIDAIGVSISTRAASPTGTMKVQLYDNTASVEIAAVTINVSDIQSASRNGWYVFKLASSVTLTAGNAYKIGALTSSSSQVNLYYSSTTTNWLRFLRETSDNTPAAGDILIVAGEVTGAGTSNSFTVTMNNTATTQFGTNVAATTALAVCAFSTLNWGTSASTNYNLYLAGHLELWAYGTMNIGTSSTAMPRTSTATLKIVSGASKAFAIYGYALSTFNAYGATITTKAKLAADKAVGSTSITTDVTTNWVANDVVIVSSTLQDGLTDRKTVSSSSGTTVNFSSGLSYAHLGNSTIWALALNVTRNVKIIGTSTTYPVYISIQAVAAVFRYVEFAFISQFIPDGSNYDIQYCSFYDWSTQNVAKINPSGLPGTFNNNIAFDSSSNNNGLFFVATSTGGTTYDGNVFLTSARAATTTIVLISIANITFTNTYIAGGDSGFSAGGAAYTFTDCIISSCNNGISYGSSQTFADFTVTNTNFWVNQSYGLNLNGWINSATVKGCNFYGNSTSINIANSSNINLILDTVKSNGTTTYASSYGLAFNGYTNGNIYMNRCDFSSASGILVAHSTNDIRIAAGTPKIYVNNCKLGASTPVNLGGATTLNGAEVKAERLGQTTNNHKTWKKYGIINLDTTIYNTASPSARLTPNSASFKLESGSFKAAVASGQALKPSVYVRSSVVGDGTAYNGNYPRLVLKRNDAIGITADTVLATATATASGAFEQLTATTSGATDNGAMEFIVDCDGTTGWVNVDDFTVA